MTLVMPAHESLQQLRSLRYIITAASRALPKLRPIKEIKFEPSVLELRSV